MIELSPTQRIIIDVLSDGCCHSGTKLGQELKITRSAVWKQINQLIEWGVPIVSLPNQGYKLKNNLILLNKQKIHNELKKSNWTNPFNLHLFDSIDSTNRYLKELPHSSQLEVCCAELQTHGRGRFSRYWFSPFGENIYLSIRWNLHCDLTKLSGLSLITSLAIAACLKKLNYSKKIKVKWPNDILWNDKKLCGNLIEIIAESNATAQVIIGIGLNVNSDTKNHPLPDKPWCSLYELSNKMHDRNELIAHLIIHLEHYIILFLNHDLECFMGEWSQYDYLINKQITVTQLQDSLSGKACGINNLGQLILEDNFGKIHLLSSGDTSLKIL